MPSTRRIAAYVTALIATFVLAGCGGDGGSEPAEQETPDDTSQPTSDSSADNGESADDNAADKCVGDGKGSITVTSDAVDLPGGSTATIAATDVEQDPPTVSFDLGQATKIEQQNAADLTVGDQFGVARSVYVVVRICTDEAMLDEF